MKISRQVGTASEIVNVFIQNATVSTGVGLANVSASSVNFSWCRNNQATISSGTCSSNTVLGTYSTSALIQLSSTSSLGWYQFGAPNGVFVSGGSAVLHLFGGPAAMAPVPMEIELTATNNQTILAVSVSTMATPVGVSSASVTLGVSTIAVDQKLVGVSTIAVAEKLVGVSTIAVSQKLVGVSTLSVPVGVSSASVDFGVSTISVAQKLVGVSTMASPVGVSSASVNFGVSTLATSVSSVTGSVDVSSYSAEVGVSSASMNFGVSTLATSVDVSSMNSAAVVGTGTPSDLWRGV